MNPSAGGTGTAKRQDTAPSRPLIVGEDPPSIRVREGVLATDRSDRSTTIKQGSRTATGADRDLRSRPSILLRSAPGRHVTELARWGSQLMHIGDRDNESADVMACETAIAGVVID